MSILIRYREYRNMFTHQPTRRGQNYLLYSLLLSGIVSSLATTQEVTETPRRCNSNEFECTNGFCIVDLWRCDDEDDCRDNSDEINCPDIVIECNEGQFRCATGSCIPGRWLCDQELDCNDGSDEQGCISYTEQPMFKCEDLQSDIPVTWRCDGQDDCGDQSDEIDCASSETMAPSFTCRDGTLMDSVHRCDAIPHCQQGEDEKDCSDCPGFLCSNDRCIQTSQYCDGYSDCKNGDDEPASCNPSCMVENGGCAQICLDRGNTVVCECRDGYDLYDDALCQDHNECLDEEDVCPGHPMLCVNQPGTFTCECPPGFIFETEHHTCYAADSVSPPVIFSTRESVMYLPKVDTNSTMNLTPGKFFRGITAIDFDPQEGTIFFSEIGPQRIVKYFLTSGEEGVIADEGVDLVDGIAYDWIYDNLYFTESRRKKVEVISLKTLFRKILFDSNLDEPRAIAVNPMEGYVYFTDWGVHPKIEKAAMDGSSRQIIIDEILYWPNGLCIEYTLRRLFWVNAVPSGYDGSFIASSDLNGRRIKILVEGPSRVQLPFAISVFQDNIYWTDWGMESLMTANSFTGAGCSVVLRNIPAPMDIKVFNRKAKYRGDEENITAVENHCPTNWNACSHMCLAAPNSNRYSCGCPNDAYLGDDMKTCFCNATAKLNEDGVTCGGPNVENATPTNALIDPMRTPLPEEPPIKFDLTMKCRIINRALKCRVKSSLELLTMSDNIPEELSCKLSKDTGELICKF